MDSSSSSEIDKLARRLVVKDDDSAACNRAWDAARSLVEIGPKSIHALLKLFDQSDNSTARPLAC